MKKLFVSDYVGFDESATKATLYSFDSEDECREFLELSHDERCQVFNVFDEGDNYGVLPGAAYHTYVVDNKSRVLKARSTRAKATKADAELDAYLRQLYIYSAAVENEYGIRPDSLCFNCFREERFIVEPFRQEAYMEATEWLKDSVATIRQETDFNPSIEFFKCAYLCEMQDTCEYYELSKKR